MNSAMGRLVVHARGFGFLRDTEGHSHFVPPPLLKGFLLHDECAAEIEWESDDRSKVTEIELVSRERRTVFGKARRRGKRWILVPDAEVANHELRLLKGRRRLSDGDTVLCDLVEDGFRLRSVFGANQESERDVARVASRHNLALDFAAEAMNAARSLKKPRIDRLGQQRRDLRDVVTITVDAPTTRDIDDAIGVLPADSGGGLRLFVSIADVAELISEDSALDRAARDRATSVYLIGKVLPMFPPALANERLSLLPGKERLTLTVELRIDPEGRVTSVDVYESVIRSLRRVSYTEANDFLAGTKRPEDARLAEAFSWFRTASARLGTQRRRRGGFENPHVEPKVELDTESGEPTSVVAHPQNAAHIMIERFMVAANEAVARWLSDRGQDCLYRCHAPPTPEKVRDLVRFSRNFGFEPGLTDSLSPLGLAAFSEQIRGTPSAAAVFNVLMKCLGRAGYSTANGGHFGLGSEAYLHFTSPIRRYADLQIHRIVKAYLGGLREPQERGLDALAEHIGRRSWAASKAERDHQRILWARYLANKIGERFDGNITGVASFGLFVQLRDSRIQGLVGVEALPGRSPRFDERALTLRCGKRSYEIGQPLRVRVVSTDVEQGRVELALARASRRRK